MTPSQIDRYNTKAENLGFRVLSVFKENPHADVYLRPIIESDPSGPDPPAFLDQRDQTTSELEELLAVHSWKAEENLQVTNRVSDLKAILSDHSTPAVHTSCLFHWTILESLRNFNSSKVRSFKISLKAERIEESSPELQRQEYNNYKDLVMATHPQVNLPLPVLPAGWAGEKDFKAIGSLSSATERSIEPVGPHFLAHARRARHKRTFSEDDRIQAQINVKKVEDDDAGEISEPEDPMMLSRDAKDWKVRVGNCMW